MGRLFTFGCSFTKYDWPTWVDFVSTKFNETHNYGQPGAGNYYIYSKILEADFTHKLTKEDTVLVMFTSAVRYDFIGYGGGWNTFGNLYNSPLNGDFSEKYWSPLHGLNVFYTSIISTFDFLNKIGCKYKIMTAFNPKYVFEHLQFNIKNHTSNPFFNYQVDYISKTLPNLSLHDFSKDENKEHNKWYYFNSGVNNGYDGHPTIRNHHNWVKYHIPEYYDDKMVGLMERWESMVVGDREHNISIFKNIVK